MSKNAVLRYDANNCTRISLKLNKTTDADIINAIGSIGKQGTIKALIRYALYHNSIELQKRESK